MLRKIIVIDKSPFNTDHSVYNCDICYLNIEEYLLLQVKSQILLYSNREKRQKVKIFAKCL